MDIKPEERMQIIPLGRRVVIHKQEDRKKTKGGIILPDNVSIPQITGFIVEVSKELTLDESFPVEELDRVLFNPSRAIPVDLETKAGLLVVPSEDVIAVLKRELDN